MKYPGSEDLLGQNRDPTWRFMGSSKWAISRVMMVITHIKGGAYSPTYNYQRTSKFGIILYCCRAPLSQASQSKHGTLF